jgi:hypothetical protein
MIVGCAKIIERRCSNRITQMRLENEENKTTHKCLVRRTLDIEDNSLENFINKRISIYKLPIIICKSVINNNVNEKINKVIIERLNQGLFDLLDDINKLVENGILNESEYMIFCNQLKEDKEEFDLFCKVIMYLK